MPKLERQAIGRGRLGSVVVVQFWSGLPDDRFAVVYLKDGVVTNQRSGTYNARLKDFDHAAAHLRTNPLTEDQARDGLAAAGLPRETFCTTCACRMPLGSRYCTACGRPGNYISGTLGQPAPGSNAAPVLLTEYRAPADTPSS